LRIAASMGAAWWKIARRRFARQLLWGTGSNWMCRPRAMAKRWFSMMRRSTA
jgi:hypothetical protein